MKDDYERAKQKVKKKKEFIEHLNSYLGVMVLLFVINVFLFRGRGMWMIYPMMGWGVGLVIHYFSVFGFPGIRQIDDEWEDEEIRKEMERQRTRKHQNYSDDVQTEERKLPDLDKSPTMDLPDPPRQKDKLEDLIDGDTFKD